ncbi:MAG TPA: hypothetical protein VFT86_08120, partial [Gaiellaceae bacterium]|nr:hypothetical protein [Gaiellaceae bacterium]
MWPAVPTVSGIAPRSNRPRCSRARSPRGEQLSPLGLVALATGEEREHQQVEPLAAARVVAFGDNCLEEDEAAVWWCCGADRAQNRLCLLVGPVVEDRRQQVGVGLRDALEEAALDELDPFAAQELLVANRLREVEDDAAQSGLSAQELDEQGAVAASDVDDCLALAPFDVLEALDPLVLALLHRHV